MINNFKNVEIQKNLIKPKAEFLVQFIPFRFKLIYLENNIFDWIEINIFKKCIFCSGYPLYQYICLICGEKMCIEKNCNHVLMHLDECTGGSGILIHLYKMKLIFIDNFNVRNELYPLYIDETGLGPNNYTIGNEFNLSKDKIKIVLRNYIANNF